jgi:V/A-type H+/Na+-transporting ATPase subunit C
LYADPDMSRAMKTFRKVPRYGQAVGRVMVKEGALLNRQRVTRLVESDYDEAMAVLQETEYGPYLEGRMVSREIDEGLEEFLSDQYDFLDEVCGGTLVAQYLRLKYDFHNMKVVLKEKYFGSGLEPVFSRLGGLDVEQLRLQAESRTGEVPGYWRKLMDTINRKMEGREDDPGWLDALADRRYLERRLELARMERSKFLVDYTRATVDVANIRVLLRGKNLDKPSEYYRAALAEGGRIEKRRMVDVAGDPHERMSSRLLSTRYGRMLEQVLEGGDGGVRLTTLDRQSDEYLLEKLAGLARIKIGPERIVRYILSRENEVVLVRVTMMGKIHNLTPEQIEKVINPAYMGEGSQ